MTHSKAIDAALRVLNLTGYSVFPANPATKAPCLNDPFANAARTEDAIRELFRRNPEAVPAIPCGPVNGITVIDLDRKNGVDGLASLRELGVDLPYTSVVSTPTGGFHVYLATAQSVYPCSAGRLGPGIDIRGHGGYVIGPGAETPKGTYVWRSDLFGPDWAPAEMPSGVARLILNGTKPRSMRNGPISLVRSRLNAPIMEGRRNEEFAARIGYLLRHTNEEEAWRIACHLNDTVTQPPLQERELRRIFDSIRKREAKK